MNEKRRSSCSSRRRVRPLLGLLTLGMVASGLWSSAEARTVKIISADRLELRKVAGTLQPDGSKSEDQELVVISGLKVELHIDQDVILATRVEYNRTRRTLTLVGIGEYDSVQNGSPQVLKGRGLVVDLGTQALDGQDVIVSDSNLEIRGDAVSRVPGQLTASNSYFTPCAKCGRTPNDYAFRAKSVLLYPGDRLVAYDATLLLAGAPVLFLPIVVLPLQDQSRQPRLNIAQDAVDGLTVQADLPFVIGSTTLGTTLLRYYQNRRPRVGFGVDLHSYAPIAGIDKIDLYGLANPKPSAVTSNADGTQTITPGGDDEFDVRFSVKGKFPLYGSAAGVAYSLTANRNDIGRSATDPQRGVTDIAGSASADFPSVEFGSINTQLNVQERLGPEPKTALPGVLKREIVIDPGAYRLGTLSADFKVTLGQYTAASNPQSRSAQLQGPNFSTARLEESHVLAFTTKPWQNATFSVGNTFTGRYYLTGARTVNLGLTASLEQSFGVGNSVQLAYAYTRQEGTSPFAFDSVFNRPPSGILTGTVSVTPAKDFTLSASQAYDYVQPRENQPPAQLTARASRSPVNFNLSLSPNLFKGQLEAASLDATVGQDRPLTLGLRTSYTLTGGPAPISLSADVVGGPRTNTFGVTLNYDVKSLALSSVNLRAAGTVTRDTVLTPVNFTATEAINLETSIPATGNPATDNPAAPPLVTQTPSLSGQATVNAYGLSFGVTHQLSLPRGNPASDTVFASLGSQAGSAVNWNLRYGGTYDTALLGFNNPTLTGSLTATRPGQRLSAQATLNVPGLNTIATELSSASVAGSYDLGRASLSGGAYYSRSRQTPFGPSLPTVTDTLTFQPLTFTVGLGSGPKPGAYLSTILRQTLTWQDGVLQPPGRFLPIFLLTVDRCCWAFQVEINPLDQRYRVGVSLPGQDNIIPAFEANPDKIGVPLLTPGR